MEMEGTKIMWLIRAIETRIPLNGWRLTPDEIEDALRILLGRADLAPTWAECNSPSTDAPGEKVK